MAKKKNTEDRNIDMLADITKLTGGTTLDLAGEVPYFVDTGNFALNYMCSGRFVGGGFPGGRIIEVYGPPATSKSLLGYCCLGAVQRMGGIAVLLDCERAGNAEFAERAGNVDSTKLIVYEPVSIQQVESKIIAATKAIRKFYGVEIPILFVWDSIGVTPTEREWSEMDLPENPTQAQLKAVGSERPGERARAAGDLLRKINPFLNEQNATLFIINQIRKTISTMPYANPNVGAGGGEALKFYASCRLETAVGKTIETKNELPLGVNLRFTNRKSRSSTPGLKTKGIQLFFDSGINPLGGLLSIMIANERVVPYAKGRYRVDDKYSDGQDITFSANKEKNEIPLEVLLKAPKLVDAENEEQLRDYLKPYSKAIEFANSDSIVEKSALEDEIKGTSEEE